MDLRLVGLNLRQAGRPTHTWRCSASRYASESPNPGRRTTAPTHRHNGQTPSSRVPIGTVVKRVRSVFVGCEPSSVRSIVAGCVASFNLGPYLSTYLCPSEPQPRPADLSPSEPQPVPIPPNHRPYPSPSKHDAWSNVCGSRAVLVANPSAQWSNACDRPSTDVNPAVPVALPSLSVEGGS